MLENMLKDICGPDIFSSIYDTLSVNLFSSSGKFSIVLDAIRILYNVVMPIGVFVMFIYFIVSLEDTLASENFTWEQLWKKLAMLLVAKIVMEHGFELMELLFNVGMAIAAKINNAVMGEDIQELTFDAKAMIESFRAELGMTGLLKVLADIILFIYLLFPWLLSWLMRLAISLICYSRVIEIYVRAVMAPIALSDFYHGGLQSTGWRFLKSFFAVSLQGATILLISIIFSLLMRTITAADASHPMAFIGSYLAFYGSAVMLMFKSLPLTKELVGVN